MHDSNFLARLLVTGATGKVGTHFIRKFLDSPAHSGWVVRALCHHRTLAPADRLEVISGSLDDRTTASLAMHGVTHVLHLATCKETPEQIMDVAVKGLFWLLEEARTSNSFRQFILIGGDAATGHFHYPHPIPVTETQQHTAYPGCYALSKVIEETMLQQYMVQYELNACCLRAPWIMEKDDFKFSLNFGPAVFGAPRWGGLVTPEESRRFEAEDRIPIMIGADGKPVLRNFVHVEDLSTAIMAALDHPAAARQTFNICMDEPINYQKVADHLARTRKLPSVKIQTPYHSTWLDNAKARFLLDWRPTYDMARLIDEAWDYRRSPSDPRKIWYPG